MIEINKGVTTIMKYKFTYLPKLYKGKIFWMEPIIITKEIKYIYKSYKIFKILINVEYKREIVIDIN